ncbi:hypothetical protein L873DRAFT_1123050 [Choiromyces venosus 120613-1]|uniref:Glycosyl hydrolase family 95 N-terminal domain-containing protein n=1 Tax=Choiromyces venosus 120613-1 TaxID=1336337 RepID=A0A3N4JGT3_9PEZI|nr:hypothetical protein L873DRAFT_1123050 [Choiromyces venosus 120613-1]
MISGRPGAELLSLDEDSIWSGGPMNRKNPTTLATLPIVRDLLDQGRIIEASRRLLGGMSATPISPRAYQPLGDLTLDFGHSGNITD